MSEKELAIRRFTLFWNQSYISYIKLRLSNINKVGLNFMLDFLEHENPLIRYVSKHWLI